jgi:diguanylate cyclase (GGDEF)-like protein
VLNIVASAQEKREAMTAKSVTGRDVLRRTAGVVAMSVCCTMILNATACALLFGTNPEACLASGFVTIANISIAVLTSALVSSGLSYRSNRLLLELTLARAELWRISRTDQLTGLLNRRGFDEAAISVLANARGTNSPAVALMCDLDRFKAINDQFGHEFGDAVLVKIGEVLRSFAKENEILVGRHGGEEFVALVTGATAKQAAQFAETLRQACADKEVFHRGASTRVTISIGLCEPRNSESNLSEMLRTADLALYTAKHGGRNRVARADILDDPVAA